MHRKTIIVIGVTVACSALAYWIGYIIHRVGHEEVVVSTQRAAFGSVVVSEIFEYRGWPLFVLPTGEVKIIRAGQADLIVYRKKQVFQDANPHTPIVTIEGQSMVIDDGEAPFSLVLQSTVSKQP